MRLFICLFIFFICSAVLAEEIKTTENKVPIAKDINSRLEKVEKAVNNNALFDMLELLESLKTEVSELRGITEVQTHTIDQLKQKQRDLYTDIDKRLQRVETNKPLVTTSEPEETLVAPKEQNIASEDAEKAKLEKEPVDPLKAEAAYQKAFKLLKESQYDQALVAFKAFLKDYPDSPFSDNAQYWLGEANYVIQKYELAINEYQALLNTFPNSKKVSQALLKIGYSYAELGNVADAKKTLIEVKTQYPGTTAARLADERLRKIGSTKGSST